MFKRKGLRMKNDFSLVGLHEAQANLYQPIKSVASTNELMISMLRVFDLTGKTCTLGESIKCQSVDGQKVLLNRFPTK